MSWTAAPRPPRSRPAGSAPSWANETELGRRAEIAAQAAGGVPSWANRAETAAWARTGRRAETIAQDTPPGARRAGPTAPRSPPPCRDRAAQPTNESAPTNCAETVAWARAGRRAETATQGLNMGDARKPRGTPPLPPTMPAASSIELAAGAELLQGSTWAIAWRGRYRR